MSDKPAENGELSEGQSKAIGVITGLISRFFRVPEQDTQKILQAIHIALSEWRAVVHGGELRDGREFVGLVALQEQTQRLEESVKKLHGTTYEDLPMEGASDE